MSDASNVAPAASEISSLRHRDKHGRSLDYRKGNTRTGLKSCTI